MKVVVKILSKLKLIKNYRFTKRVRFYSELLTDQKSATTNVTKSGVLNKVSAKYITDTLNTNFDDPESSYKSKTTWEVFRAYVVYVLCSFSYLVENNDRLMKWTCKLLGQKLFGLLMKATFYGHFVAGEDRDTIVPKLVRIHSFGVNYILDYSVEEDLSKEEVRKREVLLAMPNILNGDAKTLGEMPQYKLDNNFADRRYKVHSARTYFYLNEATCEKNTEIFLDCLHGVAGITGGTGFTAIKMTALGRPQMLMALSEVIMRARRFVNDIYGGNGHVMKQHLTTGELEGRLFKAGIKDTAAFLENVVTDQEGVIHLFPWSGIIDENLHLNEAFKIPSLSQGRMVPLLSKLSEWEEVMFRNMIRRLKTLVETAKALNARLMVDAEQTYFQPAISRITMEMMKHYNVNRTVVYNTYQCYRKDALDEVVTDLEEAKRQGFHFGAKFVRGAYMDQERARALALGYPDPINPTYEDTTKLYHDTLSYCIDQISAKRNDSINIMVATHNEDTVRFVIDKMKKADISPQEKVVSFGQLFGMCDYITFPLGQAGYSACKYIPYGPVNEVLPYLSRRIQENRGILQKINKERRILVREIVRRIKSGQIFYKPRGHYKPV